MDLVTNSPEAGPYRGADRRGSGRSRDGARLRPLPAVAAILVMVVIGALLATSDPARGRALADSLSLGRAVLLSGAGLLCLVRWQVTGLARPAFVGVALLVLGVLAELLPRLASLLYGGQAPALPGRLATAAAAVAAALLLGWVQRAPAIDATIRPSRLLLLVSVTVPLVCVIVVLVVMAYAPSNSAAPVVATTAPVAVLWLSMTVSEQLAGLHRRSAWLVGTLGCVSVASLLELAAAFELGPANVLAAVFGMAAGVVAVHGSSVDVRLSLAAQSSNLLRLTVDSYDHRQQKLSADAQEQERLHEVRDVLAGVHGATATLRMYEDRLDPGVRRRLEDAVTDELRRLSHLVDPAALAPLVAVDVAEAVGAVIVAGRELGMEISVDLRGTTVVGRSADLATVVSALLANARRHAPGSPVVLRAETSQNETRIYVEDRGPGVPLGQREAIFERGERGDATAPGTGLGLYTAKRLNDDMGGTLHVEARAGGGASFVLTLPSGVAGTGSRPGCGAAAHSCG